MEEENEVTAVVAPTAATSTSPWAAAIACSAVLAIFIGGALFVLHQRLLDRMSAEVEQIDASVKSLSGRITALEAQTATLAAATRPDPAPIDALNAGLATTNNKLGEITTRLDALEKQKLPVATPAAAVEHVAPPSTVAVPVPSPSPALDEEALRKQLKDILAALPKLNAEGDKATFVEKINDRFAGFISIKKQDTQDAYATLRAHIATADMATINHDLDGLSAAERKPFAAWIASYRAALAGNAAAPTDKKVN